MDHVAISEMTNLTVDKVKGITKQLKNENAVSQALEEYLVSKADRFKRLNRAQMSGRRAANHVALRRYATVYSSLPLLPCVHPQLSASSLPYFA